MKVGIATSVLALQWESAEIDPRPTDPLLAVSEAQRRMLETFASQ
ncbi:MAG: hypothetical protein QOI01_6680 [Mycobacterium sp.]|nr:hypothetical protein [Mycobacterium sp.]